MKIAQVAPLYEAVPPRQYGGTERIVSYITEELVKQGHEVTLFASGDSKTTARLIAPCEAALRTNEHCEIPEIYHMLMLEDVFDLAHRFDVLHFHVDYSHFPLSRRHHVPGVTTLHGRLDLPDLVPMYRRYPDMPVVSISDAQRRPLPWINWRRTVYHGLPDDLLTFGEGSGGYLSFIGRISPEKRVDRAIEIARRSGIPLKIAAKVDRVDRVYFHEQIEPLLDDPLIEFIGEIGDTEKDAFLGNSLALLFPIDWPEPFGLAMIEAMACGTPVIAFRCGSVPEVMCDGESGFIVDSIDEAVRAVERVPSLSRRECRAYFDRRFSARRMVHDYVAVYEELVAAGKSAVSVSNGRRVRRPMRAGMASSRLSSNGQHASTVADGQGA
jgi:glycosyltransferase involved in cell wall biosynthesis